jgi:hypothetical protein
MSWVANVIALIASIIESAPVHDLVPPIGVHHPLSHRHIAGPMSQ